MLVRFLFALVPYSFRGAGSTNARCTASNTSSSALADFAICPPFFLPEPNPKRMFFESIPGETRVKVSGERTGGVCDVRP
jgi:hypothetical protein